jgi:hypothetical protein
MHWQCAQSPNCQPAERVEFGNWTTLDTFKAPACDGVGSCPLHIQHPPNGTEVLYHRTRTHAPTAIAITYMARCTNVFAMQEFCLGCSMCKTSGFRFGSTTQT